MAASRQRRRDYFRKEDFPPTDMVWKNLSGFIKYDLIYFINLSNFVFLPMQTNCLTKALTERETEVKGKHVRSE